MIFTTRDLDILRFLRWCRFVLAEDLTGVFSKTEVQNLEILRLIKPYPPRASLHADRRGKPAARRCFFETPRRSRPGLQSR